MRKRTLKIERAMLVYQGGIANVFQVDCFNLAPYGRHAYRLAQADFRTCFCIAQGMGKAGTTVRTAYCNQAGDIRDAQWSDDRDSQPFSDQVVVITAN